MQGGLSKFMFTLVFSMLFNTVSAQIVDIPDVNFKQALIDEGVDANGDGEIQVSEAEIVKRIFVKEKGIKTLKGINSFTNLEWLDCKRNEIDSLELIKLEKIRRLDCEWNNLKSIHFSIENEIVSINCSWNFLTSLDFSILNKLTSIDCSNNNLAELPIVNTEFVRTIYCSNNNIDFIDLTKYPNIVNFGFANNNISNLNFELNRKLDYIDISGNPIDSISLFGLRKLKTLRFHNTNIDKIDFSTNLGLKKLYVSANLGLLDLSINSQLEKLICWHTSIEFLDLSKNNNLTELDIYGSNLIERLNVKNSSCLERLRFGYNDSLKYICSNECNLEIIERELDESELRDVEVNSYCSFDPVGESCIYSGTLSFSFDNCATVENYIPYSKLAILSEEKDGQTISNVDGVFEISLPFGNYSIIPLIDNSSYFELSPELVLLNLSPDKSEEEQIFCVSPIGVKNDWEVSILPIDRARPGFESQYKLIVNNNGNTNLTGSVSVFYDSSIMGVVNADDFPSEVDGTLSWDFGNGELLDELGPFESKEINFTMILNRPTDNPSLNNGDIVSLVAEIGFDKVDETPENNRFKLKQVVVNSFDPNDKTCLEGNSILPEMIGEYLHYLIRFENKGSAEAVNIVVRDVIDTTKFDISSVEITVASHNQYTRIENGVIEFIFEGINLPFEDAVNDGYVAFKIKTKDELIIGDKVENAAEIYFDFNSPIITNTAESIFEIISPIQEVAEGLDIKIFPNPTFGELNIVSESGIRKVELYRTDGKLIGFLNSDDVISLKDIPEGIYLLSVSTDEGKYVEKIVKH